MVSPPKFFTRALMGFPTLMGSYGGWVFALDVTRGGIATHVAKNSKSCQMLINSNANGIFPTLMGSDGGWIFVLDVTRGTLCSTSEKKSFDPTLMEFPPIMGADSGWVFALNVTRGGNNPRLD